MLYHAETGAVCMKQAQHAINWGQESPAGNSEARAACKYTNLREKNTSAMSMWIIKRIYTQRLNTRPVVQQLL